MKKSPDSTGSLVLILLALVLTATLSVWCVSLIVSAGGLRDQHRLNDERLVSLDSIHSGIDDLNNLLVAASVPDIQLPD
ncbi:MAG: hypothetical protein V3T28_09005 [Gemmatimonadales bacterium]